MTTAQIDYITPDDCQEYRYGVYFIPWLSFLSYRLDKGPLRNAVAQIDSLIVILLPVHNPNPGEQELALMSVALDGLGCRDNGHPLLHVLAGGVALAAEE